MKPNYSRVVKHYCLQFQIMKGKSNTIRISELKTEQESNGLKF